MQEMLGHFFGSPRGLGAGKRPISQEFIDTDGGNLGKEQKRPGTFGESQQVPLLR
jgi:hypothetical protein